MRPLLFLDIDGVLNVLPRTTPIPAPTIMKRVPSWSPEGTPGRVQRLLEHFDPVWATAWLGGAHSHWRDYLGLDPMPWPYITFRQWKLIEIIRHAGERPWAWVDDDALWELQELNWTLDMVPGLVVAPNTWVGLTDDHVEQLLEFAHASVDS